MAYLVSLCVISDEEEDTATAKLKISTGQLATKGVILVNKDIALNNVTYRLVFSQVLIFLCFT